MLSNSALSTPLTYSDMHEGSGAATAGLSVALNQTITVSEAGLYFIGHSSRGQNSGGYGVTRVIGAPDLPSPTAANDVLDGLSSIRYLPAGAALSTELVSPYTDIRTDTGVSYNGHFEIVRRF